MNDKFVLPNENTEASHNNKIMKYHLKSNYVATVNPARLRSLTFKITNEDNQSVGTALVTNATTTVNNTAGYKAGVNVVAVADGSTFAPYDAVFNSNNKFVGFINQIDTNNIYFLKGTLEPLYNGENLYIPATSVRSGVKVIMLRLWYITISINC